MRAETGGRRTAVSRPARSPSTSAAHNHLYIGGGNAKRITFEPDPDVTIVGNTAGITSGETVTDWTAFTRRAGGVAAWHD